MPHWKRILVAATLLIVCAAVLLVLLTWRWFIAPKSTIPGQVDAAIVLSGGNGERLPTALQLMDAGIAPTLIVSLGGRYWTPDAAWRTVNDYCDKASPPFNLTCVRVEPNSTRGEGAAFAKLAAERGWRRLVVVTSDYHVKRSLMWFGRCFSGDAFGLAADTEPAWRLIAHEWLGFLAQNTIQRACIQSPSVTPARQ